MIYTDYKAKERRAHEFDV